MNDWIMVLLWVFFNLGFVWYLFYRHRSKLRQEIREAKKEKNKLIRLLRELRKLQDGKD